MSEGDKFCEHCGGLLLMFYWADGVQYSWAHALRQEADACLSKRIDELVGDGK